MKPQDLEAALKQMARQGWRIHNIIGARFAGRQWLARQTLDVTEYHVVLRRPV